jgi:hypothetical protein
MFVASNTGGNPNSRNYKRNAKRILTPHKNVTDAEAVRLVGRLTSQLNELHVRQENRGGFSRYDVVRQLGAWASWT